ncbi:MAG: tol-pal system YbgF family protein [Planctomycetota bacterium JB042]
MRNLANLLVFGVSAALLAEASADEIRFVDGRKPQQNVEVLDETLDKIEYRLAGVRQTQSYPSDKVLEVVYTRASDEYDVAMENLEFGAFSDAADLFKVAAQDARRQKGLAAKCLFLAGDAYRRGGMFDQAIKTFDDLESQHPDSRYVPEARLARGLSYLQSGNEGKARQEFGKLRSDAGKLGARWGYEGELRVQMLDESKDPGTALATYRRLAKETEMSHPTVANQAKLRIGRVLIAQGKSDEAEAFFRRILDQRSASAREVVAGAFNGLGTSLRNKAGATAAEMKEALYAHLRVVVSFEEVAHELPEALYGAGKCFQVVPAEDAVNRSRQMFYRVINEYPNSEWAAKAKQG